MIDGCFNKRLKIINRSGMLSHHTVEMMKNVLTDDNDVLIERSICISTIELGIDLHCYSMILVVHYFEGPPLIPLSPHCQHIFG